MSQGSSPQLLANQQVATQRTIEDLRRILEVCNAMTAISDLDELLAYIRKAATDLLSCDRSTIFMVDQRTNELWCRSVDNAEMREIRFPVGVGISGKVAQTGTVSNIPDAYADPSFNREVDKKTGYRTRNLLTMPLRNFEGKIIGVVQMLNKNGGAFTEYDESVLNAMSSNAAIALEKAVLMQHFLDKKALEASLAIARDIQHSLLPDAPPEVEGVELAGVSSSCDETGGDYFDYFILPDGKLAMVIGDVSGHGVGSALLMATARAFLKALVCGDMPELTTLFTRLNDLLEADTDDSKFMTLFMGVYDPAKAELVYVSGGHDEPAHVHAKTGEITEYKSTGLPLGVMSGMDFGVAGPYKLEPGDLLFLSTDGVFEAPNAKAEHFGKERQNRVLLDGIGKSAQAVLDNMMRAVLGHIDGASRKDDITMIVLKKK